MAMQIYSSSGGAEMFSAIALYVLCPELDAAKSVVVLPRSATVADLRREACAELGISEEEVTLWDYFGGQCYASLEDRLQQSLSSARLMDRQAVLLKGKNGVAPSPISLVSDGWSKPPDMLLVFDDNSQLAVHRCILELSSPLLQDILAQSPPGTLPAESRAQQPPISPPTPNCTQAATAQATAWVSPPVTPSHPSAVDAATAHGTPFMAWGQAMPRLAGAASSGLSTSPTGATHRLSCATSTGSSSGMTSSNASQTTGTQDPKGLSLAGLKHAVGSKQHLAGMDSDPDVFVLRVPGDERYSWVYALQLMYPCCQMRRPPITWSNITRILALADKWAISSVLKVCQDFLLLPSSQLSTCASDPAYVWRWIVTADRFNMPLVVRKCIAFIQMARVASGYDRQQLDKAVAEVVHQCSQPVLTQLITSLCAFKDELQAAAK